MLKSISKLIISVPIMTPRLSSYWLHFVTSTSYPLAVSLVDSMNMEIIAKDQRLQKLLKFVPTLMTKQYKWPLDELHKIQW